MLHAWVRDPSEPGLDWLDEDRLAGKTCPAASGLILRNAMIPVPSLKHPEPTTTPVPGAFYRVQPNGWGLLRMAERTYGTSSKQARLAAAKRINEHPYNGLFHVTGRWPFDAGQIDMRPRFAHGLAAQAQGFAGAQPFRSPRGRRLPVVFLPGNKTRPIPSIRGSVGGLKFYDYWFAAGRVAFDAWLRLRALRRMQFGQAQTEWWTGTEWLYFGMHVSDRKLKTVERRMGKIARKLQEPRFKIHARFRKKDFARSTPGVKTIWLHKAWCDDGSGWDMANERVQTLIHEVGHIVGLTSRSEFRKELDPSGKKKYAKYAGQKGAKKLADDNAKMAMWSPENYGYYALSQAIIAPLK